MSEDFIRALESDAQAFSGQWHHLKQLMDAWEANIKADPIGHCTLAWDECLKMRIHLEKAKDTYQRAVLPPIVWRPDLAPVPEYYRDEVVKVRGREYHALLQFYKDMTQEKT